MSREFKCYGWYNGSRVSAYGMQHGYMDYACLTRNYNMVLNNHIHSCDIGYWELVNGCDYWEDETGEITDYKDIYQEYIIDEFAARELMEISNEIVYYNDVLDIYLLAITHWGTSWDYVLTDIPVIKEEN